MTDNESPSSPIEQATEDTSRASRSAKSLSSNLWNELKEASNTAVQVVTDIAKQIDLNLESAYQDPLKAAGLLDKGFNIPTGEIPGAEKGMQLPVGDKGFNIPTGEMQPGDKGFNIPTGEMQPGDKGFNIPTGEMQPGDKGFNIPTGEIPGAEKGISVPVGDKGFNIPTGEIPGAEKGIHIPVGDEGFHIPTGEMQPGDKGFNIPTGEMPSSGDKDFNIPTGEMSNARTLPELPTTPNPMDTVVAPTTDNAGAPPKDTTTAPGDKTAGKATKGAYGEDNPFYGAEIKKDVPPEEHVVKPGDTLTKIAKEHLGPGASKDEIHKHVMEIAKLNHIKDPNLILDGQKLQIPGHTADGGTVIRDEGKHENVTTWKDKTERVNRDDGTGFTRKPDGSENHWGPKPTDNYTVKKTADGGTQVTDYHGNKTTSWADGTVRHENADGTGDVKKPNEGGGYSEHHWGPKPEDNYDVIKTADGKYKIADNEGDKVGHEPKDTKERIEAQRARLNEDLENKFKNDPAGLDRAKQDMKEFEKRAAEQEPPMAPEEIAKTYEQVSKLLESTGDVPVKQSDRTMLAEQVLHQAAHPNEVRQGYHGTCNVTTVESRMYLRNPSEAARVVTEAATTGQVKMSDGRVVQVPSGSLQPDFQGVNNPSPDNQRSFASQVFQVTAVNDYYDRLNRATTPPGQLTYEQVTPTGPTDTGERVFNNATTPRTPATDAAGNPISPPDIPTSELETISNNITGKNEKDFVFINGMFGDNNTVKVKSEKDLGKQLEQAKKDGKMPIIIWVDAQNEPFFTDSGAGTNGGAGGAHVVTITDYDPATGQAKIDNQWSQSGDHSVSLHDLYGATRPSTSAESLASIEKDVAWDKVKGTEDGFKEMEMLRLEKNAGKLTDAQYDAAIIATMKRQQQDWTDEGETYPGEKAKTLAKYNQMLKFLPAARAAAIRTATGV